MDQILDYVAQLSPPTAEPKPATIRRQLDALDEFIRSEAPSARVQRPVLQTAVFGASRSGDGSVLQRTVRRISPRRMRRGLVAAITAVGVIGGGAAAAAVLARSGTVTDRSVARCYSVANLAGGRHYSGSDVASAGPAVSASASQSALDACAVLWRNGFLVPGAPHALHLPGGVLPQHPVPPLVVCVLPSGEAGVFPGNSSTCERLGLPSAPSS